MSPAWPRQGEGAVGAERGAAYHPAVHLHCTVPRDGAPEVEVVSEPIELVEEALHGPSHLRLLQLPPTTVGRGVGVVGEVVGHQGLRQTRRDDTTAEVDTRTRAGELE